MLASGKLTNLKPTDGGLVAEIAIESMTPAMVDAILEQAQVELSLPTAPSPRAHTDVALVLAGRARDFA